MTNRLELNWKLNGFVDEQRYYCSETLIDVNNLPAPKAVLSNDVRSYVDVAVEVGKTYYVAVGSVKNSVEKLSEQKQIEVGLWTPLNLPFEIVFVSSDDVVVNSSNSVEQMTDVGGGDRHFSQSSENRKPILIEHSNFNIIRFDGVNDVLGSVSANNFLAGKNCAWIFTVFKTSVTRTQSIVAMRSSNNSVGRFNIYAGTNQFPTKIGLLSRSTDGSATALTYDTESTTTTNFRIVLGYRDYTQTHQKVVVDGSNTYMTTTATGAIPSTQGSGLASIGAENASAGNPFGGDVCCVLIGTSQLTQQDEDKLFGWAAHKYGLTDNLPIGHPYKTLAPTT